MSDSPVKYIPDPNDKLAVSPDDILEEIKRLISEPSTQEELERAMHLVRVGHEQRIKLVAMAVAQQRLSRIMRHLATIDRLESELFAMERLGKKAKTMDLVRSLQYLSTEVYRAVDLVTEQVDPEEVLHPDMHFHVHEHGEVDETKRITKEDREKLRVFIKEIAKRFEMEIEGVDDRGPKALPSALPRGREVG